MIKTNVTNPPTTIPAPVYPRLVTHNTGGIYLMFKEEGPDNAIGLTDDCVTGTRITSVGKVFTKDFKGTVTLRNDG